MNEINTQMAGAEERWTFLGSDNPWKQRADGVILPPIWAILGEADAPLYFKTYASYADDLTREDYAFLSSAILGDLDLSVDFQIRSGSVTNMGVGIRAQDSRSMYCVIVEDMGRKGYSFGVTLWMQDGTGLRRLIGSGIVPHPETPDRIRQTGARNDEDWIASSHGWSTLRVRAQGPQIEVLIDDKPALECQDNTYATGAVALMARWAIPFKDLKLSGVAATLSRPWRTVPGQAPDYCQPFDGRLGAYEAYPAVTQDANGKIYVVSNVGEEGFDERGIGIVNSTDGGKTWADPRRFDDLGRYAKPGQKHEMAGHSPSLYVHRDGRLSCFFRYRISTSEPEMIGVAESHDDGQTWSEARELIVSGTPVSKLTTSGQICLYSPVLRLKDGTLLICGYHYDAIRGGNMESNAERRDRSVIFRSTDDGETWAGPHYLSEDNFDHNECMIAELPDGRLKAFMRTLSAPTMWTSSSHDQGLTWSPLEQSGVAAECPCLLSHSSGTVLLGSRGSGVYINVTRDAGQTWQVFRIAPASGMMGMVELSDGRILIVYHTGYRCPGRIRAQLLLVTPTGLELA